MRRSVGLGAALAALLVAPAAQAQVKIKIADAYPNGHFVAENTVKVFMAEAKKLSGGKVDFEYYPSEQLGKVRDFLRLMQSGVAEMANITPSYVSDKMPLTGVSELPGGYASSCQGTMAMWQMSREGMLAKQEFEANGIRLLIAYTFAPYQLFTSKKITSLDEMKGLKIRSLGPVMDITIRKLGAVPLQIVATETHEALSRGTLDGTFNNIATIFGYDLTSLLKSATRHEQLGGAFITYSIREQTWKSLSPDVQKALETAGENATRFGCKASDEFLTPAYQKLEGAGVAVFQPSQAERERVKALLASVGEEWAEGMEKRGRPGKAALQAFREASAKAMVTN